MEQGFMTIVLTNGRGKSLRFLGVTVALLISLALLTSVAFADTGSDPAKASDELCRCGSTSNGANPSMDVALWYAPVVGTSGIDRGRMIRAGANPSMDVALWYAGQELSFLSTSRALRTGANPSMDVALWYAGPELSFLNASRALRADANPSMDVAQWYAGPELSFLNTSRVLRADANPSMDVALWYLPAEVGSEELLCLAQASGVLCP